MTPGQRLWLTLRGWAGVVAVPVRWISPVGLRRARVELLADAVLPGRRRGTVGQIVTVPSSAVSADVPAGAATLSDAERRRATPSDAERR